MSQVVVALSQLLVLDLAGGLMHPHGEPQQSARTAVQPPDSFPCQVHWPQQFPLQVLQGGLVVRGGVVVGAVVVVVPEQGPYPVMFPHDP